MISKTQIRYMANSSSYSKGAELYATGKVLDMDVKNMGASDEIVASVKGSGRNIYEVDVSIDTENDEVDTCYCECRAYAEYGGLCKHCVAVLLQYNDYENDMDSYDYGQSVEKIVKRWSDPYDQKRSADAYHAGIGFIIAEAGSCEVSSTDSGKHLWKSKAGTIF
mgnify:FL=1